MSAMHTFFITPKSTILNPDTANSRFHPSRRLIWLNNRDARSMGPATSCGK